MFSSHAVFILGGLMLWSCDGARADDNASVPSTLDVSTSMAVRDHHLPKYAFDGTSDTYFLTHDGVKMGDDFTVVLPSSLQATGLTIRTGTPDHKNQLAHGVLEISQDGTTFSAAAPFAGGTATVTAPAGSLHAFRVVVGEADASPLAINEITIAGAPTVLPVRFRTRFLTDYQQAPEAKAFAETCKSLCEEWYPRFSDQFDTPEAPPQRSVVRLIFDLNKGVAYAATAGDGISEIHVSKIWAVEHPDDTALIIHESFHIVQGYSGVAGHNNLGWLTEGLADYVRNRLFKRVVIRPDPNKAKYTDSYQTTAAFLMWLEDAKKQGICFKLNAAMRISNSQVLDVFTAETGQNVDSLWADYIAYLRKG